jgi:hypothetical protein
MTDDDFVDDCVDGELPLLTAPQPQSKERAIKSTRQFMEGHGVLGILIIAPSLARVFPE